MAEVSARPRVIVVQFPGVNCEHETARLLRAVGLDGVIVRWNAPENAFAGAVAYVLPGGFAYEDRVRAGAIAARQPVMERIARAASDGLPVLGICNGAQVLVESGLVPGGEDGAVTMALAPNRMRGRSGYYTRWVVLEVTRSPSIFTQTLEPGSLVPMPMAHGEGRFTSASDEVLRALEAGRHVPFRYVRSDGAPADRFPDDPNGSVGAAAAVSSADGRVMALMPHPERAAWLWQVPAWLPGEWGRKRREWVSGRAPGAVAMSEGGPGIEIFRGLARDLGVEAA